jgi:hypothetical protein
MFRKKQTCADCHFFVKEARDLPTPQPIVLDVALSERATAKANDFTWAKQYHALGCHFGVWDEGYNFDMAKRFEVIADTDRRDLCFFWRFRPGMLIPAAKILQEREARDREAGKDRCLTVLGLWIAAVALLVNAVFTIGEKLQFWPTLRTLLRRLIGA